MRVKKTKAQITDKELTPTVLAIVKKDRLNPLYLIILLLIFGAVIFFLPEVGILINKYIIPKVDSRLTDITKKKTKYPFSYSLTIKEKDLFTLSNFNARENKLEFTILNLQEKPLDMTKYNYFLEMFDDKNTLLQRIHLKDISLDSNASTKVVYDISNDNINYLVLREIKVNEYPAYNMIQDENGNSLLTCTKENEKIEYYFKNNSLLKIKDTFELSTNDNNYANLWTTYQNLAAEYNKTNGVKSLINNENDKLTFTTDIDLNINDNVKIRNIIYKKNTIGKVIHFELEANGYICN